MAAAEAEADHSTRITAEERERGIDDREGALPDDGQEWIGERLLYFSRCSSSPSAVGGMWLTDTTTQSERNNEENVFSFFFLCGSMDREKRERASLVSTPTSTSSLLLRLLPPPPPRPSPQSRRQTAAVAAATTNTAGAQGKKSYLPLPSSTATRPACAAPVACHHCKLTQPCIPSFPSAPVARFCSSCLPGPVSPRACEHRHFHLQSRSRSGRCRCGGRDAAAGNGSRAIADHHLFQLRRTQSSPLWIMIHATTAV